VRIDVSCATIFPVEYLRSPDHYAGTKALNFFAKAGLASEGFSGIEAHFRNMDLAKVDLQVLSVSVSFQFRERK